MEPVYTLYNEEKGCKEQFAISEDLQIEYENLNPNIAVLRVQNNAGSPQDMTQVGVRIQDTGTDIPATCYLADGVVVIYQRPDSVPNYHSVLLHDREVLRFEPVARVIVYRSADIGEM